MADVEREHKRAGDSEGRFEKVLADYLQRVDNGEPVDREQFIAQHPDFADDLRSYLEGADEVERMAGPLTASKQHGTNDIGLPVDAGSPVARVVMEVIEGPHKGEHFEFNRHDTFLVGRADIAHLRLQNDRYFSRHHFRLEINPPACYLVDLGSRNGIFVNGDRVRETFVKHGDVISGGRTQIRVSVFGTPAFEDQDTATVLCQAGADRGADTIVSANAPGGDQTIYPVIPGYDLQDELGRGAMGVVYHALRKSTGQQVALKVIIPAHSATDQGMQFFLREASILAQLNHPHIVRFHEFGTSAGHLFLSMEFVDTVDLADVLRRQSGEARVRIGCAIACQILDALSHAHSLSLVHRDIKPANILVSRSGRKLNAKLADFGLAKNYANVGFSDITRDGDFRGTIAFTPPEQIVNCRFSKPTVDIYAVGATLYRLLSGQLPFDFSGDRSKLAVILEDRPVPLERRCPQIPKGLANIVGRALAKDAAKRFQSAAEMRDALLPYSRRTQPC